MPGLTRDNRRNYTLKVETALSYLDQVKHTYRDQPQLYNDFLNIMTEFKSQKIDTPGVINRVMNLFKDHPELIQGFNAFLPPGYKIDVVRSHQSGPPRVQSGPPRVSEDVAVSSPSASTSATSQDQLSTVPSFNNAINFVNKVKNRFSNQPDKYRRFLEILHAYQREIRPSIADNTVRRAGSLEVEVFVKVTRLFENHRDLVRDFVQMLPPGDPSATYYPSVVPEE